MGHKLMERTEAAYGDAVINMSPDKSVLILLKHCQDMKRQETRLRLITLFLLLGCTALFIFTMYADFRRHESSGFSQRGSPAEHSPVYSKQEALCGTATDNPQNESRRVHNDLRSVVEDNVAHKTHMKWEPVYGENYSEQERAIVIPVTGPYFVYANFDLRCNAESEAFERFSVKLQRLPYGYNEIENLTDSRSVIKCPSERYRTVFVGRLFHLLEEDRVKVWLSEGYKLIASSSFGVFRV